MISNAFVEDNNKKKNNTNFRVLDFSVKRM